MTPLTLSLPLPRNSPSSPRTILPLLLLLLVLCLLSPIASAGRPADFVDSVVAHLPFDFTGPTIPPNFASFSVEPYALFDWSDRHPALVNPAFVRLLSSLHPTPHSPGPVLRIGGNSADCASYNPTHGPRPPVPLGRPLWYDVTDSDLLSLRAAAEAINGRLVLGVNFRTPGDAGVAVEWLRAVERLVGWRWVEAIEIGNEPDVYEWTQLRPTGYNLSTYTDEWLTYARALHEALPQLPEPIFQGGAFGSLAWAGEWHRFMSEARNYLKSMAFHHYPLSLCQGGTPTVHRLLSDQSSQGAARALLRTQALNHVRGYALPLVVSEGSSVSCGRMPGVSNSYASALWAIDQMLVDASVGIRSWHFHYAGGNTTLTYSPLVRQPGVGGKDGVLVVQPIFYGLRFFALATLNHSTVYRVNVTETSNPHVKVYALITSEGHVQVVLVHKDASTTHDAVVTLSLALPVAFSALPYASVLRLTAPSATSATGVKLGGQTYDGSVDGEMVGEAEREWIQPVEGLYTVQVSRLSAVLLTLRADGPYHMDDSALSSAQGGSAEGGSAIGMGATWQQHPAAQLSSFEVDDEVPSPISRHSRGSSHGADDDEGDEEVGTTADASVEGSAIASFGGLGAGMPASRRGRLGQALQPGATSMDDEGWRVRRGRFALSDAKANYEQQIEDRVERLLSERRTGLK